MVQIFQRESIFCSKISSGWSVFGNRKVIVSFHTLYARTWTAKQAHTANYTIGSRDTTGARPHGPRTQTQPSHEAIFGFGRSLYTVEIHKIPDHVVQLSLSRSLKWSYTIWLKYRTLNSMHVDIKRIRILACKGLKQRLVVVFWPPKWPYLRTSNSCGSMPLASAHMLTYALGYSAAY